jgi:maltokinase
VGLAVSLGTLTADLHAALATASSVISEPVGRVPGSEIQGWSRAGFDVLEDALAIDAEDADLVRAAADSLRRDIGALAAIRTSTTQPVHGDLHVGQVLRWVGGLAVVDFDGAPRPVGADATPGRQPVARDVAHLLCSLDLLAVVVDRRTGGRHTQILRNWAVDARAVFLEAYRERARHTGLESGLDERLLRPFLAEQLCRELVYAAEMLPRWRYAPIGALRWRYLESGL